MENKEADTDTSQDPEAPGYRQNRTHPKWRRDALTLLTPQPQNAAETERYQNTK